MADSAASYVHANFPGVGDIRRRLNVERRQASASASTTSGIGVGLDDDGVVVDAAAWQFNSREGPTTHVIGKCVDPRGGIPGPLSLSRQPRGRASTFDRPIGLERNAAGLA